MYDMDERREQTVPVAAPMEKKRLKAKIGTSRWGRTISFVRRGGVWIDISAELYSEIMRTRQHWAGNPVRYYFVTLRGEKEKKWVHSMHGTWGGARCITSKHQKEVNKIAELCLVVSSRTQGL